MWLTVPVNRLRIYCAQFGKRTAYNSLLIKRVRTCICVYRVGENVEFLGRLFKGDLEDEIIYDEIYFLVRKKREGETHGSMDRDKVVIRRNVAGKSKCCFCS